MGYLVESIWPSFELRLFAFILECWSGRRLFNGNILLPPLNKYGGPEMQLWKMIVRSSEVIWLLLMIASRNIRLSLTIQYQLGFSSMNRESHSEPIWKCSKFSSCAARVHRWNAARLAALHDCFESPIQLGVKRFYDVDIMLIMLMMWVKQ